MQEGERRLMVIIPLSLALIFILLYLAFHSLIDAVVVLCNVLALSLGGIWALLLTGTNFSIAAAVGFTSIFGVAIMDGLLLVSSFNQLRAEGLPLREAIMQGAERRIRPVMMTALTAIFGLLPAAVSTKIGAQTQKPLAIVVVGSMIATLLLTRYLMPVLYSLYGDREPEQGRQPTWRTDLISQSSLAVAARQHAEKPAGMAHHPVRALVDKTRSTVKVYLA